MCRGAQQRDVTAAPPLVIFTSDCEFPRLCLPDLAALHREDAVEEHQEAHQGCGKQHPGVPAEPGEVQADLLPEIPPGAGKDGSNAGGGGEQKKVLDLVQTAPFTLFLLLFSVKGPFRTLPDEVQWLILVPNPPPGPALVQQVQLVLRSVRSDRIFAVILPLRRRET